MKDSDLIRLIVDFNFCYNNLLAASSKQRVMENYCELLQSAWKIYQEKMKCIEDPDAAVDWKNFRNAETRGEKQ